MPQATYIPLQTITLSSSASSVTFGSIPGTYKDLVVVIGNLSATANYSPYVRINGDTGANYSYVMATGESSSGSGRSVSGSTTSGALLGVYWQGIPTSGSSQAIIQIMDYSATDKHKTGLSRYGSAGMSETDMTAFRWASTNAITSLTFWISVSTSYNAGTTFSLYGIA